MEQRRRRLSEAVLVHCTDVCDLLERLFGEKKLELGIVRCWKMFLEYTLIHFEYYLSRHYPRVRLIFFKIKIAERLFRWVSARLPKVWFTLKLDELPSCVFVAD